MYGASMGSLKVTINGRQVFTASGNKGNTWLKADIDVNLSGMYAVSSIFIPLSKSRKERLIFYKV